MFAAAPDRQVYFAGSSAKADNRPTFDMGSRIVYMMEGGTALIIFEEDVGESVKRKCLKLKILFPLTNQDPFFILRKMFIKSP